MLRREFLALGGTMLLPRLTCGVAPFSQNAVMVSGQAQSVMLAAFDAKTLKEPCFHRYFHFVDSLTPAEMQRWQWHFNSLSDQGDFGVLTRLSDHLIRLDVQEFGWDKRLAVLELFATQDIYFHARATVLQDVDVEQVVTKGGRFSKKGRQRNELKAVRKRKGDVINVGGFGLPAKELTLLRELLVTDAPVISGDFFFSRTVRQTDLDNNDNPGTGYYDMLGLKDRQAFFDLIGFDEKLARAKYKELREVILANKGGVSQQNRQIVAFNATTGRVWITLDVFKEKGRGIAVRNLRSGEFEFDVQEIYGFLPNGLPVTFLSDNKGARQASAPPQIGGDDSPLRVGKDFRIHVQLACLRCHGGSDQLQSIDKGWARTEINGIPRAKGIQDLDKRVLLELRRQYLGDLKRWLTLDRAEYVHAIGLVTGHDKVKPFTSTQITSSVGKKWNKDVEAPVKLEDAARWWGTTPQVIVAQLSRWKKVRGGGDFVFDAYLEDPPESVSRLSFEDGYQFGAALMAGLQPLEQIRKVKKVKEE